MEEELTSDRDLDEEEAISGSSKDTDEEGPDDEYGLEDDDSSFVISEVKAS